MSTKIGIVADLHGDYEGFQKALVILDREGCDYILCAGDIVDRGPQADDIVTTIQKRNIPCIAGNHDHSVVRHQEKWRKSEKQDRLRELGRIISDETVAFLQQLPATYETTIENTRILMAHGTPYSDVVAIFLDTRLSMYDRLVNEYECDVMILGHTHKPMCVHYKDTYIINAGSIYGVSIRDSHTCGILNVPSCEFRVYDVETGQRVDLVCIERGEL